MGALLFVFGLRLAARRRLDEARDRSEPTKHRWLILSGIVCALVLAPGSLAIGCAPALFPQLWLPTVARNGDVLVAAIRKYEAREGHPPPDLESLVPDSIPSLPPTGYPGKGRWRYRVTDESWTLCATIDEVMMDFYEFRYAPGTSTNVPVGYHRIVRNGDWVYMDE